MLVPILGARRAVCCPSLPVVTLRRSGTALCRQCREPGAAECMFVLATSARQNTGRCVSRHTANGNIWRRWAVLQVVTTHSDTRLDDLPVNLILIEKSGAKREIPQPSAIGGMIEAEQAIHSQGRHLREVKVVSRHQAIARWKPGEDGWRRVA